MYLDKMCKFLQSAVVFALALASARGHLAWNDAEFQPVQGLYIKPSGDGTTGDLYVAATEENGVRSQWLTDKPVNFLTAASEPQPTALPLFSALSNNALPHDETAVGTQKRAAITGQATKYAYGWPSLSSEHYAYAGIQSPKDEASPVEAPAEVAPTPAATAVPQWSPYHYLYPHMVHAAYASALKVLNDAGISSDHGSNSNAITAYPGYWPTTSYYPMRYVTMDPTAWAKQHASALSASTPVATPNEPDNENDKSQ